MKSLKSFITLCVLIACVVNSAWAQYTLTGTVKDSYGDEMVGVSVRLKDSRLGTISDLYGNYTLKDIPKGKQTIVFSFIGYQEKQVVIKFDKDSVVKRNVTLDVEEVHCDEIAVVGYSTTRSNVRGRVSAMIERQYFNTERYDAKSENTFKDTKTDPISVFSSDVDNASYSNVRRFLNQSVLPPDGSVRIEEMVNYFSYLYSQPSDDRPISIYTELGPCAWNSDHELLQIGIKAKELDPQKLPPSNLVFLLDVSGSMYDENKLPLLVRSFKVLVDGLRDMDFVSVVTYAGNDEVKLTPTKCDANGKKKICNVLDGLEAYGSTSGFNAIEKAYELAEANFLKDGNNRILLATDGDFNVGPSSNSDLQNLVKEKAKSGITLTVLGFGMGNYNDSMMETISNCGNGNYFYIDNFSEAKKALGTGLWGTLFVVAKDVKILVDFNPNIVKSYRLIGYENRLLNNEDFNDDKKDAGDMGSGHTVTALYELVTINSKDNPGVNTTESEYSSNQAGNDFTNYLTVKFRYKNPQDTVSQLIARRVSASDKPEKPTPNFVLAQNVALFGQLLSNSEFVRNCSFKTVIENLKNFPSDAKGYVDELKVLVRKADDLN